jgi:hypothetical protein
MDAAANGLRFDCEVCRAKEGRKMSTKRCDVEGCEQASQVVGAEPLPFADLPVRIKDHIDDPELSAMAVIVEALKPLGDIELERVLSYVGARFLVR